MKTGVGLDGCLQESEQPPKLGRGRRGGKRAVSLSASLGSPALRISEEELQVCEAAVMDLTVNGR